MCIATANAATEMKMYSQNNKGRRTSLVNQQFFLFRFIAKIARKLYNKTLWIY